MLEGGGKVGVRGEGSTARHTTTCKGINTLRTTLLLMLELHYQPRPLMKILWVTKEFHRYVSLTVVEVEVTVGCGAQCRGDGEVREESGGMRVDQGDACGLRRPRATTKRVGGGLGL